jgi:hypothetical protein
MTEDGVGGLVSMQAAHIQVLLDEVFDQALVHHGFVDYMRDYELIVYCTADSKTGVAPTHERLLFTNCVSASVETALSADIWSRSLDDRLIDYSTGADLDGYVWGVKWQGLYPGAKIVEASETARQWSEALGIEFHEVLIETNGHNLTLVFTELQMSEVGAGYTPFSVPHEGPDFKVPFG